MAVKPGSCPRRRLGKTELSIPVIPFGTQGFGNNFGFVSDEDACALMRHAISLGVNHFDSARCYGDSLRKVGVALKQGVIKRDEIILGGRVCCHSAAQWGGYGQGDPDYTAEQVLVDVADQLEILGTDHFDILFVHDPPTIEPTLAPGGTLEGLERAKERGWTNFVGYGMYPHASHLAVIETRRTDALLTFSDYNLLRQSAAEDILPAAAAKDMGVLNGWSIMRGWLTGKPVESFAPRDRWVEDQHRAERMRLWFEERGVRMLEFTLQFCLREKRIHGNSLGNLNVEQLEWNVAAVQAPPLPDDLFTAFTQAGL